MSEWAIETSELGQCFDDNWAIRGLNLQVPRGSVFGLLGENGAGKSTTIQTLMGLLPPSEGSVSVLGFDPQTDDVGIKSNVGYVAEKHGFYEQMRISEIIAFIGAYHRNWNDQLCDELLKEFSLEDHSESLPANGKNHCTVITFVK